MTETITRQNITRDAAIAAIRSALKRRSGKTWSVKGGRGTAWGWIRIDAPPRRQTWEFFKADDAPDVPESYRGNERDKGEPTGHMSPDDRAELGRLLGLDGPVHFQGESIPASHDHWMEYVDRAEGRAPSVVGEQYWD